MNSPRWITGANAVARLKGAGITDPEVLGVWAHEGWLTARAKVERVAGRVEADTPAHNAIPRWFWGHLRSDPVKAEWGAGVFETTAEHDGEFGMQPASWRMTGVEFNAAELDKLLENETTPRDAAQRGVLPTSAKPNDRKYEQAAHEAAGIVRDEGVAPSEAFRRALEISGRGEAPTSPERALRRTYDLMYDNKGKPYPN